MVPYVIAVDLEGTLISTAVSQIPRPGLCAFVDFCFATFDRVVLFSYVSVPRQRDVVARLIADGFVSPVVRALEHAEPRGDFKDLRELGVVPAAALLVDDNEGFVVPEQRSQWIEIAEFEPPYPESDGELARVTGVIRRRLARAGAGPRPGPGP